MQDDPVLTPAQQRAADGLLRAIPLANVMVLRSDPGMGRTTVLRRVQAGAGGALVGIREFLGVLMTHHPAAIEEAFLQCLEEHLTNHDLVIVDDLHMLTAVVYGCDYPRPGMLHAVLTAIAAGAEVQKKKLVFGVDKDDAPAPVWRRAHSWDIDPFTPTDYECICRAHLNSETAPSLDFAKIHRFAPVLNTYQLKNASMWLSRERMLNTDSFIDYLRSQDMTSNVEIEEVQPVDLKDLKGVDDVVEALETKIVLPFENDSLAAELRLKPKRGVLLAGPPGTGKTTIGRALAHRLKSKFFLIDGTVVAGSRDFYREVQGVFERAKRNAPAIIFIDDTDLIFEGDKEQGFYRYLLTMMDGLETASAERVCVMMTAMNVGSLPPAMLRSGRVELWLETRMPDEEARAAIIREKLAALPDTFASADISILAAASRGLTGADLKAVVEDGKLLFANDKSKGRQLRSFEEYFLEAIDTVRANRRNYARRKPVSFMETVKIGFTPAE